MILDTLSQNQDYKNSHVTNSYFIFVDGDVTIQNASNYEKYTKQVFSSLRDRLQHNEDLKNSLAEKPSPITKTLHGYSSSQRLKVINAFTSIRKNFRVAANQRAQQQQQKAWEQQQRQQQHELTPQKNMFPDQRLHEQESESFIGNNLSESSHAPLMPPPVPPNIPGLASFALQQSQQQQTKVVQPSASSTATEPLTASTDTAKPKTTLTQFFDSPAFRLFQKTNPDTVQQILGNALQKNSGNNATPTLADQQASASITDQVGASNTETLYPQHSAEVSMTSGVQNEEQQANTITISNEASTQQQQPSTSSAIEVQEKTTPTPKPVEKQPTPQSYIPSVRTTQQHLFVKSALGALSCVYNLSEETLLKERMQQERDEAIAKAQRSSFHHRDRDRDRDYRRSSRDHRSGRDHDRSRDRDRSHDRDSKRKRRSRSRSRDRRPRDRSRDRQSRDRSSPASRSNGEGSARIPGVIVDLPSYAKKDYANIWRKKMEEVEQSFARKYTSNEESQSEGPLVIDTGFLINMSCFKCIIFLHIFYFPPNPFGKYLYFYKSSDFILLCTLPRVVCSFEVC